jgi:hypothetical protein
MPPPVPQNEYLVDFPALWVAIDWVEHHCVIPDGFAKGQPYELADWQTWFYVNHYRVKTDAKLDGRPAMGAPAFHYRRSQVVMPQKALALDTPIATPNGWSTMERLAVGDLVFDKGGQPTRVLSKSRRWLTDTFRVEFSDGSSLVACGDHEWIVERRTKTTKAADRRAVNVEERRTTKELLAAGLTDSQGARKYRVPMAGALDLPEIELPVAPYTLGAWLGDGGQHDARITGIDLEVFKEIEGEGYRVAQDAKIEKRWQIYGLQKSLRLAGLIRNKHIPAQYLRASREQRWALLQGLMDTDGHCDARQGKCEFTTTNAALRDGMRELLHSLGIKHTLMTGEATLYGRVTGPKYRIFFSARSDMPVFRIGRKQDRLRSPGRSHAQFQHRRITAITPIEPVLTQCITVDSPSHTFLAGREMIPTGNSGKGPLTASQCCLEACGPAMFAGWAVEGDVYRCSDHGCPCGWEYWYGADEPMGVPWPTPLIQVTAFSEEQAGNIWDALRPMIEKGPLANVIPRTGEEFIRLPNEGRMDRVTSNNQSRLGQRVTFCPQDEVGLWLPMSKDGKGGNMVKVAQTQRRGTSGMSGRVVETTNGWDPSENSVAQQTALSALTKKDIFRLHRLAPSTWSFTDKRERRKILKFVYKGSWWVDLDSIEAEASEILLTDPGQAERFYGNRIVAGLGQWMDDALWEAHEEDRLVPEGTAVAGGFDGSENDDWTAIRLETQDGYRFTPRYGPDRRPAYWNPAEWGGSIPRGEVNACVDEISRRYRLRRFYCDPRDWRSEIGEWALKIGEEEVFEWSTYRIDAMFLALKRCYNDLKSGRTKHDRDRVTAQHISNARKVAKPGDKYILGKPDAHRKIDIAMADTLAHEAAADLHAIGPEAWKPKQRLTRMSGRARSY